jgi:hypothetical protein
MADYEWRCCASCHVEKPRLAFSKDNANKSGLSSWCRECQRAARQLRAQREARKLSKAATAWDNALTGAFIERPPFHSSYTETDDVVQFLTSHARAWGRNL